MELSRLQANDIKNALLQVSVDFRSSSEYQQIQIRQSNSSDISGLPKRLRCELENAQNYPYTMTLASLEITAGPLFRNSLLSTEVFVHLAKSQSTRVTHVIPEFTVNQPTFPPDFSANSPLHYRSHSPLPNGVAECIYQTAATPFVTIFTDSINPENDIQWSGLIELCTHCCGRNPFSSDTQRCTIVATGTKETPRNLIVECEKTGTVHASLHLCKLPNRLDQLNVISKSALVLGNSTAIAVDSVRSCTPFSFLSTAPPGWEALQLCVTHYLQHRNKARLIEEQKAAFLTILRSKAQHCHIVSHHTALAGLLASEVEKMNNSTFKNKHSASGGDNHIVDQPIEKIQHLSADLILAGQHNYVPTSDNHEALANIIGIGKRKFRKFQESPRRFLTDSKHWPFSASTRQ